MDLDSEEAQRRQRARQCTPAIRAAMNAPRDPPLRPPHDAPPTWQRDGPARVHPVPLLPAVPAEDGGGSRRSSEEVRA